MKLTFTRDEISVMIRDYAAAIMSEHIEHDAVIVIEDEYALPYDITVTTSSDKDDIEYAYNMKLLDTKLCYRKDRVDFLKDTIGILDGDKEEDDNETD